MMNKKYVTPLTETIETEYLCQMAAPHSAPGGDQLSNRGAIDDEDDESEGGFEQMQENLISELEREPRLSDEL